jgi:hypothetical protein
MRFKKTSACAMRNTFFLINAIKNNMKKTHGIKNLAC